MKHERSFGLSVGGVTTADVAVLTGNDRITEIARMLGGDPESDVSRAHARELLEAASSAPGELVPAETSSSKRSRRR